MLLAGLALLSLCLLFYAEFGALRSDPPLTSGALGERAPSSAGAQHLAASAPHATKPDLYPVEADPSATPSPPLPKSLRGTEVDGGLSVDDSGHFVPNPDALALFDYFLAASGEEPQQVIAQRIRDHIRHRLDPPAEGEALELLETVLGFREALRELAGAQWVPRDLERRLQWLRELRRDHFGAADAEALFGPEEERLRIQIERRQVASDPSLSAADREARLATLEDQFPEPTREARRRARGPTRVGQEVSALRVAGAGEGEVFDVRAREFGVEAADRLARLDAQRDTWRARLDDYRSERRELLEAAARGEAAPPDLDALRSHHFAESEQRRVRALEDL